MSQCPYKYSNATLCVCVSEDSPHIHRNTGRSVEMRTFWFSVGQIHKFNFFRKIKVQKDCIVVAEGKLRFRFRLRCFITVIVITQVS